MDEEISKLTHGLSSCDEGAWRTFHERFYPQLINLARARGVNENDLPDIVQGVYLRVLRHAKIIHNEQSFKAWLACLVRCEAIDHSRRKGRRSWLNERFQQWQETRRETSESQPDDRLELAMQSLNQNDGNMIRRHYLEGWSQQKLADQHQISVKAVESKLARLRKRLRLFLENSLSETK